MQDVEYDFYATLRHDRYARQADVIFLSISTHARTNNRLWRGTQDSIPFLKKLRERASAEYARRSSKTYKSQAAAERISRYIRRQTK